MSHPFPNQFSFRNTSWMELRRLSSNIEQEAQEALARICKDYHPPLLSYVTHQGYNLADAEDLTQEFFCSLIKNDTLQKADASRGKFRSFLLTCLKNFLRKKYRDQQRIKRGGNNPTTSIDAFPQAENVLCDAEPTSKQYDKVWAECIVERALVSLEKDAHRRKLPFDELRSHVLSYLSIPVQETAEKLNYSIPALKSIIYRLRQQYASYIREEIAKTVSTKEELEEELQYLIKVLTEQ